MALQLRDLAALDGPAPSAGGQPLSVAIELIDEDPEQPRSEFDPETLRELAATIADRGVCQPVSIRAHASMPGRYMLNFGARRLRAARLAGKTEIPAFLAERGDDYGQVIENEQRESLTPLELAGFVERRLHTGESLSEVARRLGKSRTYLTFVSALIDAPDWLLDLYQSGKCRGATELYELRRLHESAPERVTQWIGSRDTIGRQDVAALKARSPSGRSGEHLLEDGPSSGIAKPFSVTAAAREAHRPSRRRGRHELVLEAEFEGAVVSIDLSASPEREGEVFVSGARGERRAVAAIDLRLLRVVTAAR